MPTHTKLAGNVYEKISPYMLGFWNRIASILPTSCARKMWSLLCRIFINGI